MSEEHPSDAVLVIRVWREAGGELQARVTQGLPGDEAVLDISHAESEEQIIAKVRRFLQRVRR